MDKVNSLSHRHIPELDGLRVLLVFLVSWYHIWQQSWLTPHVGSVSLDFLLRTGYIHVDGTILLSAFLLFLPYARSMYEGERLPDRDEFYRRRVMRVVPSYYFITLLLLFAVALPWGLYASTRFMAKDILTHLTFTSTFFRDTWHATPLGGASWTLIIEMQAYLLFPYLAQSTVRHPKTTLLSLTAIAWLWRALCLLTLSDYSMVVNQLPSFLDVYTLGMLAAMVYVRLARRRDRLKERQKQALWQIGATLLAILCVWALVYVLKSQAASDGREGIQAGQMLRRPLYTALVAGVMLCLPFSMRPVRFLFGNRLMHWLSGLSLNYYLLHQNIAVHLKRLGIPPSVSKTPHKDGELLWQQRYTFLCFALSLLLAIGVTYLAEKPCARLLQKMFDQYDTKKAHRKQAL